MTISQDSRLLGWLTILVLLTIGAPASAADQAERKSPDTWYAQALTRGEAGLNITHFWSKGTMLRAETVVAGHKVITIVRGDTYYAYDGLTGEGLAIKREPEAVQRQRQRQRDRPFGNEYRILLEQGAEKIRDETMMGRPTGVYRVTDGMGKRELWVTEDAERIPLRLEIFDRSRGQNRTTDYLNWQSDLHIPDSFFDPDSSSRLETMDYREYLNRSSEQGSVGPVPVLYLSLLFTKKNE